MLYFVVALTLISFVVNVISFLQLHRVVVPEEEASRQCARQSLVFFGYPDNDAIISPCDGSDTYPPVSAIDYYNVRYEGIQK